METNLDLNDEDKKKITSLALSIKRQLDNEPAHLRFVALAMAAAMMLRHPAMIVRFMRLLRSCMLILETAINRSNIDIRSFIDGKLD